MAVTRQAIRTMGVSVTAAFLRGLQGKTAGISEQFRTNINMTTRVVQAPIAGTVGPLREWKGSRIYQNVAATAFEFAAMLYEKTITIQRTEVEDDNVGVYMPSIQMLGVQTKLWPDQQSFATLEQNPVSKFDNKPLFATDHPDLDGDGVVSNYAAGSDPAWYLFDTSKAMGAIIWGEYVAPEITARQDPDDPLVFDKDQYAWGVRARGVAAPGFWPMAYKSKLPLTSTNYENAVLAMKAAKDEVGETLDINPNLLVVNAGNEFNALRLFGRASLGGDDGDNILQNAIKWVSSNRLTGV